MTTAVGVNYGYNQLLKQVDIIAYQYYGGGAFEDMCKQTACPENDIATKELRQNFADFKQSYAEARVSR